MKKRFSKNGAFSKKAMIVGVALAVVVGLSYFGSSDYLGQSIMDMLMGGTTGCSSCGAISCTPEPNLSCDETCSDICEWSQACSSDCGGQCTIDEPSGTQDCDDTCNYLNCPG